MKTEAARCASEIRKVLKSKRIKASVRSSIFAGGDSVRVTFKELMHSKDFRDLKNELDKYQYGKFNGMIDLYEDTNMRNDIPQTKYLTIEYENDLLNIATHLI